MPNWSLSIAWIHSPKALCSVSCRLRRSARSLAVLPSLLTRADAVLETHLESLGRREDSQFTCAGLCFACLQAYTSVLHVSPVETNVVGRTHAVVHLRRDEIDVRPPLNLLEHR